MPVSIVGMRGTGKSTWLGLLHQIMETRANTQPERFNFFMSSKTTNKVIEGIRNPMKEGKFPTPTLKGDFKRLSFLMGFKANVIDRVKSVIKQLSVNALYTNYQKGMIFTIYDVPGEDVEEFKRTGRFTDKMKVILNSNIMVFLIDCEKFTRVTGTDKYKEMNKYNSDLAIFISAYCEFIYKSKTIAPEDVYPVFIMAKLDAVDKEILDKYGGKDKFVRPDLEYDEDDVKEKSIDMMTTHIGSALQQVMGAKNIGIPLEKNARFFFSGVQKDEKGDLATELVELEGREIFLNKYPTYHFMEFLDYVEELSDTYSDPEERAEEYIREGDKFDIS